MRVAARQPGGPWAWRPLWELGVATQRFARAAHAGGTWLGHGEITTIESASKAVSSRWRGSAGMDCGPLWLGGRSVERTHSGI